ncbi:hypothetical protein CHS0354_032768 [Potamilus streckersoni]|uniref:Alpha-1,3-glucosyltransferase n=1 Tax=Potamilus streckersoni TaxID=2493646 RepID=A0AAE0RY84_9BIVA|nr:hypothetical protein CHS0354_032768 [Potamilus streckersoni]
MTTMRDKFLICILIALINILIRWCVSLNDYSGAGKPPMFGDYEAQRHWSEITYNLPVKEWYTNSSQNDLMYWGLDYPPLTAYHSWICGFIAHCINPEWVALNKSRGFESEGHKLFMRYSVILADVLVYFPAVYLFFDQLKSIKTSDKVKGVFLMLLYPGLILIDHGHFQYNCISLGLTLLAVVCLTGGRDLVGSILFCLALNYKQMELYHAFPFFSYLLGSCFASAKENWFLKLVKIGLVVIVTFIVCWYPFLSDIKSALQVLHRVFPFARGLYEDKVANIWCSISVVIKLRQVLTVNQIVIMCLVTTFVAVLPSAISLMLRPSIDRFKLALINSSLAFFLFSFHVHEKSILIPALAVCLFIPEQPMSSLWFLLISTFSMLPLLIKDGLLIAYLALMVIYIILYMSAFPMSATGNMSWHLKLRKPVFCLSLTGAVALTIAMVTMEPPPHLPDLFPVLISAFSCGHFVLFFMYYNYLQLGKGVQKPSVKEMEKEKVQYSPKGYSKTGPQDISHLVRKKRI